MKLKKIAGVAVSAAILAASLFSVPMSSEAVPLLPGEMRDITTMELVRDMGVGINLGNTMECAGDWIAQWSDNSVTAYETAWGSPVITQEMIRGMAEAGFGVVRIPVAWSNKMDMSDYTINNEYMARIQQLVDWVLDEGMYAIVNIHWDNGWVNKFPENKEESMRRYVRMWEQICKGFENYGDYLMFESQNEELGWESMWNQWGGPSDKKGSFDLCNEINQKFVDVVRASGGNNPSRHLLISGYNTSIELTCDPLFKMPDDPEERCAVSVHYYTPASFAILEEDADWAKARSTWGTDSDLKELAQQLDMVKNTFINAGIPVIIGEYGCPTKNKEADSVRLYLSTVCKEAYSRQLCPVLWATPGGHYNRESCRIDDSGLQAFYKQYKVDRAPIIEAEDIVMLQRWLLNDGIDLADWKAADLAEDGILNVFDAVMMRRLFINR